MPLDIEQAFAIGFRRNRTDVLLVQCPADGARAQPAPGKGAIEMAMIRVEPMQVRVRADWFDGRPRELTWDGRRLPVLEVVGVRDETSAFPVITGPRTIFEVETEVARFTLAYRHRARRWTIEGLDRTARAA